MQKVDAKLARTPPARASHTCPYLCGAQLNENCTQSAPVHMADECIDLSATHKHTLTHRILQHSHASIVHGVWCRFNGTYGLVRVHLGQVRLEPLDRPRDLALDRLVLELLVRRLDDDCHRCVFHGLGIGIVVCGADDWGEGGGQPTKTGQLCGSFTCAASLHGLCDYACRMSVYVSIVNKKYIEAADCCRAVVVVCITFTRTCINTSETPSHFHTHTYTATQACRTQIKIKICDDTFLLDGV